MSVVYSDIGAGLHVISCFYRMSPVNSLGSINLAIKGNILYRMFCLKCLANRYNVYEVHIQKYSQQRNALRC